MSTFLAPMFQNILIGNFQLAEVLVLYNNFRMFLPGVYDGGRGYVPLDAGVHEDGGKPPAPYHSSKTM